MEALKLSLDAETAVLEYWQVSNLLLSGTLICHRLTVEPVVDFADGYGASTWPPTWADSRCDWRELWFNLRVEPPSWVAGDMAIAAGGVTGTGIGLGAPTSIPAVHTDFVYAALVEELGLAGAAALVLLYALLVLRGFRVAILARTPYAQLLAGGLALSLGVQALVIIGGVLRLIPLTGITLPFLSYGGTSIVTSAAAVGLLLRLSAEAA